MSQSILAVSLLVVILLLVLQSRRLQRRDQDLAGATEALLDREQMATLGRLMAGIAHELNTPLSAVRCAVDTRQKAIATIEEVVAELAEPARDQVDQAGLLARAERALRALQETDPVLTVAMTRTGELIRELRLAGRGQSEAAQPVDVNELVQGTLLLAEHELKHAVTVELDLGEVPPVPGWSGPLGQVLLNLVLNARQAVGAQGTIWITTMVADQAVVVKVMDDGPGLAAGLESHIFEPGFTTKDAKTGTGLGLFICRKIVNRHQGRIEVANQPAGGAEFTVTLPTHRHTESTGRC